MIGRLLERARAGRIMRGRQKAYQPRHRAQREADNHTLTDPPAPAMVPEETSGQPVSGHETAGAGAQRPTQEDVSAWIAKLGPKTSGAGLVRRYERLAHPQPDDTVFDLPPIPGQYQPSAGTVLGALGQWQWPC